jgi:GT2 family glycosyltransferase
MTHFPKVAVVIIHWNRKNLLEQFLPSVCASSYPNVEIVLADNHSSDDSVAFVRANYPQVTIVQNDDNYGYAGGYNKALQHVKADYYVLLNNDIEVPPTWIEPVVEAMEKDDILGACQPKMLDYKNHQSFEYAGACGGYMDRLGYVFCRGRLFEVLEEDKGQYDSEAYIFWATGACLFIRSEVFHAAGGFDENFFAHMEEVDLCWRVQLLGYKLKVIPSSFVYHVGGGTLNKMSPQKTYLNFRNNLIMLTKNLPWPTLFWLIPARTILDLMSSIFFLINGYPLYSAAVHRAHADYFFRFGKWWKLRKKVAPIFKNESFSGVYNGSVVAEHFIGKKRHFNDLKKPI